MRNIKLTLEYDGACFFGFQRQPGKPTIQRSLEDAFSRLFNLKIKIKSASGRTDSGVHARSQVINFYTKSGIPCENIRKGLNRYLPKEISVTSAEEVAQGFHARFRAKRKAYVYRIWNHSSRSPMQAGFSYHVMKPLRIAKMRKAAKFFVGRHDFRSFQAKGAPSGEAEEIKDTRRMIYRFCIKRKGPMLELWVEGSGFLHHMVRNMAGTLIEIGLGKADPESVRSILKACDRTHAGVTAPAHGLTLDNVTY